MIFDVFFSEKRIPSVKEINEREHFYLPATLNPYHCKYIRFGERNITAILAENDLKKDSVLKQL